MRVAVIGATGRMGQALLEAIAAHETLTLASAIVRPGSDWVDVSVPGSDIKFRDDISHALTDADVAVDFASVADLQSRANACAATQTPWLLGTTGLNPSQEATVVNTSTLTPVLFSANTSMAVNGFFNSVRELAVVLGPTYDVDIIDLHHRYKVDAPSGTALELGRAIASGWQRELREVQVASDTGGQRPSPSIAFSCVRGGAHAGEHRIVFSGADDTVELIHRASHRGVFASGALRAVSWLTSREPGLYDMADFLDSLHRS
ncbi:MAG: 4-hydroxy-tetrahydrodipicolinate reductase [Gammaproteobacteria bacterium]